MRDQAPERFREMQLRCLRGSGGRALAVKVNCLQCCAWKSEAVATCQVTDCPMWHFRPYRAKAQKNGGVGMMVTQ